MRGYVFLGCLSLGAAASAVQWVGNTQAFVTGHSLPARGAFVEPYQTVTITTQTNPIAQGQTVKVVYTTNNWATSNEVTCTWDKNIGNNSQWYAHLAGLPKGAWVYYYVKADSFGDPTRYDSNSGANYGYMNRLSPPVKTSAILQWFETDYVTIMKRLPEVVRAGYGAIYLPAPQKSGGGGWSAGYNPVDRFDLGDRWQVGSFRTHFGTTQELQELIKVAHRLGIEVYCDLVLNHNDNRGSNAITAYPDMIPEDFHIKSSADPTNWEIDFNNATSFSGQMLNNDLVGLADIAHEDGNHNQTGPLTLPPYASWNGSGKPHFLRNATMANTYPGQSPLSEDVREYLYRWTWWLRNVIGFDGFRLDAAKHMPPAFLGYAPDQPGYGSYNNGDLLHKLLWANPDTTIFAEVLSTNTYDLREYIKTGTNALDFPLFYTMKSIFSSQGFGNLGAALANDYGHDGYGVPMANGGLGPDQSVSFIQSHDEGPPQSNNLAQAFVLTRMGRPLVYYDGNNIQSGDWGHFPKPGRWDALQSSGPTLAMLDAQKRFGRGWLVNRWVAQNLYVYERQVNGQGVLLVGLNSRGDLQYQTISVDTAFAPGTILRDLGGQRPDVTVPADGRVTITVPPNSSSNNSNNALGYVLYAPLSPQNLSVTLENGESSAGKLARTLPVRSIVAPAGTYGTPESYTITDVNGLYQVNLLVNTDSTGFSAAAKLDQGVGMAGQPVNWNTPEALTDGFVPMSKLGPGKFRLDAIDMTGLEDGLHALKVRVFADTGSRPGVFSEKTLFFELRRGLNRVAPKINGTLTNMGAALAFQSRNPSSQANRLDALFADNDGQYLYLGVAGTVEANETLTNGLSLFMDTDPGSGTGITALGTLADDSGPATRLLSNAQVTAPAGFGAELGVGVLRRSSLGSAPESTFVGTPVLPPVMGAQAGAYRFRSDRAELFDRMPASIAFQPRIGAFDAYAGWQFAIPLRSIYPSGISGTTLVGLLAYLGTTGESGAILSPSNAQRAILGGRPAPQAWLTNQFLPAQNSVTTDPGTSAVVCNASISYPLKRATQITGGIALSPGRVRSVGNGIVETVWTIKNTGAGMISGPLNLEVAASAPCVNPSATSLNAQRPYFYTKSGIAPGEAITITAQYRSASTAITQSAKLFQGRGAF